MQPIHCSLLSGWRDMNYLIGWLALSAYAALWLINFDISRVAESIFILCFIIAWTFETKRTTKWNKIFLLFALFLSLQTGVYYYAVDRFPEFSGEQFKATRHVAKLFLCIAVAWWIRGSIILSRYLLTIFIMGFLSSLIINSSITEWQSGFEGRRVDLSYTNAQHAALYFGLLFIFSITWLTSYISQHKRLITYIIPAFLVALGATGIVITQTRAVWLALAIVATVGIVVAGIFFLLRWKNKQLNNANIGIPLIVVAGMLLLGAGLMKPVISDRLSAEENVIESIADGELKKIPLTSIGIRLHTWSYALEKIKERPLTGWGPESRKPLIDEGPFPDWIKARFGHFHNIYIEIALAYGILGFLAILALTAAVIKGNALLVRRGYSTWGYGLLSAWLFFSIVSAFESYAIFESGTHFYIIIGGIGMSFYLFEIRQSSRHREREND